MGYYGQKLWDILGEDYGLYYGIYVAKIMIYIEQIYWIYWVKPMGYIGQKRLDIFGQNSRYIG